MGFGIGEAAPTPLRKKSAHGVVASELPEIRDMCLYQWKGFVSGFQKMSFSSYITEVAN